MAKRVRLSPDARRAQLIELGVRMLATRTLDELSVEAHRRAGRHLARPAVPLLPSKQEFHPEVARAAAHELLDRTEPDDSLPPLEQLRARWPRSSTTSGESATTTSHSCAARPAATQTMRPDLRRHPHRTWPTGCSSISTSSACRSTRAPRLAVHGWVAFGEECVIRWLARPATSAVSARSC